MKMISSRCEVAADDGEVDEVGEVLDAFLASNPPEEIREELLGAFGKKAIPKQAEVRAQEGWWLSPEPKLYSVGYKGHRDFVLEHPEIFGEYNGDSYQIAFDLGWIRIVALSDYLDIEVGPKFSDLHLQRLQRVLGELPQVKTVYIYSNGSLYSETKYSVFVGANSVNDLASVNREYSKNAAMKLEVSSSFPKKCGCGKVYESAEEFLKQPFKKKQQELGLKDEGLQCWNKYSDKDLIHRDCNCGSTLVIEVKCPHVIEDLADDEAHKYEKEKDDKKWEEVLIDKEGTKLTRKQIRDHYIKNADKVMKQIKDKPVMLYILTDKNKPILKRKHNNKPIIIRNATEENSGNTDNLIYWLDRRVVSFHRVLDKNTDLGFVDLDVHSPLFKPAALRYAKEIAKMMKEKYHTSPTIYSSGGRGYHVEIDLKTKRDVDELRDELHDLCDELNEKYPGFTTGIVDENGVRTDTSTLKENGNLRVPYTIHEKYGLTKEPI